ncbi:GlxA family transcriptional regulator [Rahnella sp. PCH160]|uniref:GlxA family transcriptional regulator n=1 Tax=Rahnella sp. PCH160 TaxID=3447928 RepID=UPI0039FC60CB
MKMPVAVSSVSLSASGVSGQTISSLADETIPPFGDKLHIGLILWPEFPLLALSGMMDAMRYAANAGNKVQCLLSIISTQPDTPVISNTGISVKPGRAHDSPEFFDYLAIIGGDLKSLARGHAGDLKYITQAHLAKVPVVGIGTGSFILAKAGLLNGRRASVHPFHIAEFRKRFPGVCAEEGFDFIDEGDVQTCPGGISTITLATELIRQHAGEETAAKASHRLSLGYDEFRTAAVSRPANISLISDPRLRQAVMLIEQYLARPLSTAWLAHQVHLSARQLTRLFTAELGQSPRAFIRSAKLRYARWLLNNTQESITEIALRMGFSDCAHFIRHFQNEYGCTPGFWRGQNESLNEPG